MDDMAKLISTPISAKTEMKPYKGWRFIADKDGTLHHVPGHQLLKEMADLYYSEGER